MALVGAAMAESPTIQHHGLQERNAAPAPAEQWRSPAREVRNKILAVSVAWWPQFRHW